MKCRLIGKKLPQMGVDTMIIQARVGKVPVECIRESESVSSPAKLPER
jgi:hypothetical protein